MATRAPLLVSAPGIKARGRGTSALVEFIDIYPTLAELAGLPAPPRHEGTSFAPLLNSPERAWKHATFSEINRAGKLGRAIRTDTHRYVEWVDRSNVVIARELYDYRGDSNETENLANKPEHGARVAELAERLAAGWRDAIPDQP